MATLKVKIESLEQTMATVAEVMKAAGGQTGLQAEPSLIFPSWEALHRVLTPKRLEIVKVMTGQGVLTMREVARRVGRDFKAVHADLDTLVKSGVIDRADDGVVFPYDRIHFEFEIESAA
ncbi:transcriptional regulator [Rhizobium glycinendophyticum]|uniref:Transcriptional regulator n=1 Tax=Rhizobium glycinendophyticum TaxID=2589807 RepID=A0A504UH43_9HYPH|nr:transcriptional regulator [Rhizobium glycinendophyticum]TPP10125.1 transcriptional regulator [Rhizobium glycinendophyticum]